MIKLNFEQTYKHAFLKLINYLLEDEQSCYEGIAV